MRDPGRIRARLSAWWPVLAILAVCAISLEGISAEASVEFPTTDIRARAYHDGPLESRAPEPLFEWPEGADRLVGLAGLAAVLVGFRAAGLAQKRGGSQTRQLS